MKNSLPLVLVIAAFCPVIGLELEKYGTLIMGTWWNEYERFYDDNEIWVDISNPLAPDTITKDPRVPHNLELLPYGKLGTRLRSNDNFSAVFEIVAAKKVVGVKMNAVLANQLLTSYGMDIVASKWYAEWDINPMLNLLLGRSTTPANLGRSNQALYGGNGLGNIGCLTTGSSPMFQFSIHSGEDASFQWEGKVAAVSPDTLNMQVYIRDSYINGAKVSHKLPKAEGSFGINFTTGLLEAHAKATAGYLTYEMVAQSNSLPTEDSKIELQTHVWGAEAGAKVGPVSLHGTVAGGKNVGVYGVYIGNQFLARFHGRNSIVDIFYPKHFENPLTNEIAMLNGTMTEMALVLNVKPLEWLAVEGGYGTIQATHDYDAQYEINPIAPRHEKSYVTQWSDPTAYYGQVELLLAGTLTLTGEYGQHIWGPHWGYRRLSYFGFNTSVSFK